MTKVITIGFLGCGNVGSGVWRLLEGFGADIEHRAGLRFAVKKVLVRSLTRLLTTRKSRLWWNFWAVRNRLIL